ncbi:GNAT family N-acetyltransferase [Nocardia sp. NPDC001965]
MSTSFTIDPTEIHTRRLVLRAWTSADLTAVRTGARRPGWAADFPAAGDREIAEVLVEASAGPDRSGHRIVTERSSGSAIGSIGLFRRPNDGVLELGYGIVPSYRGRGYATEAATALAAHAFTAPGVHTVSASVDLANPASVRVLEKAGFARFRIAGAQAEFRLTRR